jgi:hypothetical protein
MPMQLAKKGRAGERCVSHTIAAAMKKSRSTGIRTIPTALPLSHQSTTMIKSPRRWPQ